MDKAYDNILAVARPIRSPVKEPGPMLIATPVKSDLSICAIFKTSCTCPNKTSDWGNFNCMIISATNLSFCTIAAPETIVEVSIANIATVLQLLINIFIFLTFKIDSNYTLLFTIATLDF